MQEKRATTWRWGIINGQTDGQETVKGSKNGNVTEEVAEDGEERLDGLANQSTGHGTAVRLSGLIPAVSRRPLTEVLAPGAETSEN